MNYWKKRNKKLESWIGVCERVVSQRDAEISDLRRIIDELRAEVISVKVASFNSSVK